MTERYTFAVDRQLVDSSMVWNQDNIDNSTLTDTINESYATAEEDSPTRYLSVLDSTGDITLENLNITLSNPKLEVEDSIPYTEEVPEQADETNDQVVVFNVEGSDELFGIQVVQDEDGNLQKYQFQFRKNENGHLEAIPETITLIPMEEGPQDEGQEVGEDVEYAASMDDDTGMRVYVEEDHSGEHILPDNHIEEEMDEQLEEEEETVMYESEAVEEEPVDIKPAVLQIQTVNVKQEIQDQDPQPEYDPPSLMEEETFASPLETQQIPDFQAIQEPQATTYEYETPPEDGAPIEENSLSSDLNVEESHDSPPPDNQDFEHVEVSPDMTTVQTMQNLEEEETQDFTSNLNDSDENDYHIVEGLHITGDVDSGDADHVEKPPNSNILKHALKANTESPKVLKKDNKFYLYVVQHGEKENVDSLSLEMSNLCRAKVNPRSILKSSHAMFQARNEIDVNAAQDERLNKRFARCKEAMQAMLFHNFINKTTIPQAPVRKDRLPRKQKIKPVERMDEEIVVQEMMVSNNGFVETGSGAGVNKENLAVTEYVDLTDSDDDYDPKRSTRRKKRHRRKRVEITISDDSDASHDSVIELDESDDETAEEPKSTNNNTPPKRRRGRPPKNKAGDSPTPSSESPAKKTKVEPIEAPTKPEIPCPKCDKNFPSQNSLKTHLQHHNLLQIKKALPEYKYKCDKCATTFINNILLRKHMCSKLFNCSVCKKTFPDLSSLNGHKRTHAKEQMMKSTTTVRVSPKKIKPVLPTNTFKAPKTSTLKCKTCGKLCSSLQNLNVHVKTHREFTCGTCSKSFPSQLMLEKHVRESCVKSPQSRRSRMRSAMEGGKKPQSTPLKLRSKSVTSPGGKRGNERRVTINLKVKCEQCLMCFSSHQALFKHKVLEHGVETPDKSILKKEERQQSCKGSIPAGNKLLNSFAGINCQLNFNK